jgi:hypothetical protein
MTTRFWIAGAYSTRAGFRKKMLASCKHRHRSRGAAERCADKQPVRVRPGVIRWWRAIEIFMVPKGQRP